MAESLELMAKSSSELEHDGGARCGRTLLGSPASRSLRFAARTGCAGRMRTFSGLNPLVEMLWKSFDGHPGFGHDGQGVSPLRAGSGSSA